MLSNTQRVGVLAIVEGDVTDSVGERLTLTERFRRALRADGPRLPHVRRPHTHGRSASSIELGLRVGARMLRRCKGRPGDVHRRVSPTSERSGPARATGRAR